MCVVDVKKRRLRDRVSLAYYHIKPRTLTDVAAYSKKGKSPDDQSERSRFNPSI